MSQPMISRPIERSDRGVVLRRDRGNNPLGGVAAGISNYLGIDVVFVRATFIVLGFAFSLGMILYVALYWLMPAAEDDDVVGYPPGSSGLRSS